MANLSDNKNFPVKTLVTSLALGASHLAAEFVEAAHRVNSDNGHTNGGKALGRIQIVLDADGALAPRMYIATGRDPEAKWSVTDTGVASVVPAYTTIPAPQVGVGTDIKPNFNNTTHKPCGLASVPFPIVLQSMLSNLGHTVNYYEYSGKKQGTVVLVDFTSFLGYAIATGPNPADPWIVHDGSVLVPTGTLRPATSTEHADYKPTVSNADWITSIDFPVIDKGALAAMEYMELYSTYETSLARLHETSVVMIDFATNKLHLMYCLVDEVAQTVTWVDLGGSVADIVVGTAVAAGAITKAAGTVGDPAIGTITGYCPIGTTINITATSDATGNWGFGHVTEKAYTSSELALALGEFLKGWTGITAGSVGDNRVGFAPFGATTTVTLTAFDVTYP